jgi:hypothetical protein
MSDVNFTPNSTAWLSFTCGVPGVVVLLQIEHGQLDDAIVVEKVRSDDVPTVPMLSAERT